MLKDLIDLPLRLLMVAAVMFFGYFGPVTAIYFPMDVGLVELPPVDSDGDAASYYDELYGDEDGEGAAAKTEDGDDSEYVSLGKEANKGYDIPKEVADFVERFGLQNAKTLEVGAGSGQLQDIVENYTGLDIAESAARYFHKPFVQGSATDLPFEDDSFDVAWTIWTIEHVPDPEKAMEELRRVVRPGGMIYFFPAWNCVSWAATGIEQRPYENLRFTEKVAKASLDLRGNFLFRASYMAPVRALRYGYWKLTGAETRLRYTAIAPNYTHYWVADADATVSLDTAEAMIWFESRGDDCVNCPETLKGTILIPHEALFIEVSE